MQHNLWKSCCQTLAVVICVTFCQTDLSFANDSGLLNKIVETGRRNGALLKSGVGSGVYLNRGPKGSVPHIIDYSVRFDGPKYVLDLRTQTPPDKQAEFTRIVLVNDNSGALFRNLFSPLLNGVECEAEVFDDSPASFRLSSNGMEIRPWSLTQEFWRIAARLGDREITAIDEIGDNIIEITYPIGKLHQTISVDSQTCHVLRLETIRPQRSDGISTVVVCQCEWASASGIDYVKRVKVTRTNSGILESLNELTFNSFSPNAAILASEFSFKSLEFCDGARILDQRPGASTLIYYPEQNRRNDVGSMPKILSTFPTQLPK